MKKSLSAATIIIASATFAPAQEAHILRADFLSPGFSSEHRLFPNASLSANIGFAPIGSFAGIW